MNRQAENACAQNQVLSKISTTQSAIAKKVDVLESSVREIKERIQALHTELLHVAIRVDRVCARYISEQQPCLVGLSECLTLTTHGNKYVVVLLQICLHRKAFYLGRKDKKGWGGGVTVGFNLIGG